MTHKDILSIDRVNLHSETKRASIMKRAFRKLRPLLSEKREDIANLWVRALIDSYPADSAPFLMNRKNKFNNPVGYTIAQVAEAVVGAIAEGADLSELSSSMDKIIRIRAVQDFSPSQALSFVYDLKGIVRKCLKKPLKDSGLRAELEEFDAFVDSLGLLAFDIYVGCKEQLYQIRVDEVKRNTYMLLKQAKMLVERPEEDQGPQNLV